MIRLTGFSCCVIQGNSWNFLKLVDFAGKIGYFNKE